MLPGPRPDPLILVEGIQRDDDHPLGALGSQASIDIIERTSRSRHTESRRQPARETIEIIVRTKRLGTVRRAALAGRVQVDDIKVGCVCEGAAAEAPKPQNNEFAAGKAAVRLR